MFKILWKIFFPAYAEKRYSTIRFAFPLVIVTALFTSLASVITQDSSYVTIRTNAENVHRDEQFIIEVLVTAHIPVNAVDLVITYPDDQIEIEGVDTGTSVITLWTEKPYAKDGSIYLRGGTFRKGFIGEHTIARIKAHAIEAGDARIIIKDTQLVAGDGKGSPVDVTKNKEFNEVKIIVTGTEDGLIKAKAEISLVTDTDGDGDVDINDITAFMSAWFTRSRFFDFNGDGRMTFSDFSILLADSFFK